MVYAAVVNAYGETPEYSIIDIAEPTEAQVRIKIHAAGVHNLVRSRAAGRHFSVQGKAPPHIPGVDGVGEVVGTGQLVYFSCFFNPTGSLAEEIVVGKHEIVPLPEGAHAATLAVLTNPAQSSWMALAARAGLESGSPFTVAIVGATGVSGQAAVQIAKAYGATHVVAIGKPGAKLEKTKELGATATIDLQEKVEETDFEAAGQVDVVLDYLWGNVAAASLNGIIAKRKDPSQRLAWVQIGSLAGEESHLAASTLRKANIAVLGCAPGSWSFPELGAQLPKLLTAMVERGLETDFVMKKLEDVGNWWNETVGPRTVVQP